MKKKPQIISGFATLAAVLTLGVLMSPKFSQASKQVKDNTEAFRLDVPTHKCTGPKIATDGRCTHTNDRLCSDLNGCDGSEN
jgi:hypothetical protein